MRSTQAISIISRAVTSAATATDSVLPGRAKTIVTAAATATGSKAEQAQVRLAYPGFWVSHQWLPLQRPGRQSQADRREDVTTGRLAASPSTQQYPCCVSVVHHPVCSCLPCSRGHRHQRGQLHVRRPAGQQHMPVAILVQKWNFADSTCSYLPRKHLVHGAAALMDNAMLLLLNMSYYANNSVNSPGLLYFTASGSGTVLLL
jgi:hypothetical protein